MLRESGVVVRTSGENLWIETQAKSSCSSCGATSCSSSVLSGIFKTKANTLVLKNTLDAQVGDTVSVGIDDAVLVRSALLGYLWPLLSMIALAVCANSLGFGEIVQFLAALIGLFLGLKFAKTISTSPFSSGPGIKLIQVEGQAQINVLQPTFKGNLND